MKCNQTILFARTSRFLFMGTRLEDTQVMFDKKNSKTVHDDSMQMLERRRKKKKMICNVEVEKNVRVSKHERHEMRGRFLSEEASLSHH